MSLQLFNAVNNNDLYHLQEVIMEEPDMDIDAAIMGSMTPLHVAAEKGYSSCVKVLLSCGANVNITDENGYTALMNSAASGWPLVVRSLLQTRGCSCINATTSSGLTALHMACKLGSLSIVGLLLQAGAKPDIVSRTGETPLSLALKHCSRDVAQLLLLGCTHLDPNTQFSVLPNPLFLLLKRCSYDVAKCLLLAGYCGRRDFQLYCQEHPTENLMETSASEDLMLSDKWNILTILQHIYAPACLQHFSRLAIRKSLHFNIWEKVEQLNLPQTMREYVCFKDCYTPPSLASECEVASASSSELN